MPTPRRSRVLLAVLVVLLLAAAGVGAWFALRPGESANRPAATSPSQTVRVARTTQQRLVSAAGTIAPRSQANLNFAVGGTVTAVQARVGQQVGRGAPLAQLDRTQLQSSLQLAQAQLDAAAANASQLRDAGNATSAQLESADAQVTSATAKRDQAQQSLADADLTSPIDGTVALVNIATGDKVAAGQSSSSGLGTSNTSTGGSSGSSSGQSGQGGAGQGGSGQGGSGQGGSGQGGSGQGDSGSAGGGQSGSQQGAAQSGSAQSGSAGSGAAQGAQIVVIATDSWLVNAQVTAADLPQIKPDQPVDIIPAGSSEKLAGTVAQVGVMASAASGGQAATFPVTIAVTGNRSGLYAGGSAAVSIMVQQYPNILTVPTAAILTENQKTVVHQLVDGRQVTTEVTVGQVFGTVTEITRGLKEGDEVVVAGRSFSRPPSAGSGGFGPRRGGG